MYRYRGFLASAWVSVGLAGCIANFGNEPGQNTGASSLPGPGSAAPATNSSSLSPSSQSNVSTGLPGSPDSSQSGPGSQSSKSQTSSEAGPGTGNEPEPECKTGQVFDGCHETADGQAIDFPSGLPLGNCKAGRKTCIAGSWGACEGAIAPMDKDNCEIPGDDADCDGVPNSGCDCIAGETRPCGVSEIGACKLGTQSCENGKWSDSCEGAVFPSPEQCDGAKIDEDCDGRTDLEDSDCDCLNDSQAYCERAGVKGDCKWGQKTCKSGKWSRCAEWAKSMPEVCGQREEVAGVVWTGDENCDGGVDTSPIGKPGPKGCMRMMLDQDSDGFGRIGIDLSKAKDGQDLSSILGTACLCPDRPDMNEKVSEGWVPEVRGRENRDCGDCQPGLGGRQVYPGSLLATERPNKCLRKLGWRLGDSSNGLGDFDLNCDGYHTDPTNEDGSVAPIRCEVLPGEACGYVGNGRLIPGPDRRLRCGGSFEIAECVPKFALETPKTDTGTGTGTGNTVTGTATDNTGTTASSSGTPTQVVVFKGCEINPIGRKHKIKCQ